ncbi:MAG: hypothetical protein O2887_14000 [Bacteroidetes bacterium]|nr:hypothetical protein [Bacteroidota bacterium]MDA1121582.1 hypothetical protein [Bacteroidota bacterium]
MGYFKNLLVGVDQLGNAIAAGNPDNTISSRVGYFSLDKDRVTSYWKTMEFIIDTTFRPVDGPNHCRDSFYADHEDVFYDGGNDFVRVILSIIIIISCIKISILLYTIWVVRRLFGYKKNNF